MGGLGSKKELWETTSPGLGSRAPAGAGRVRALRPGRAPRLPGLRRPPARLAGN